MNTLRKLAVPAALLGALLLLSGCASAGTVEGAWGTEDGPNLTLSDDGTLSGSDGCNRLMGKWEGDVAEVDFGEVAGTRMACEGVDTWLSGLATGTVKGDTLHVLSADGTEIGSLERQ